MVSGRQQLASVWRAVVRGCTPHGPAQVRQGPRTKQVAVTYDDGPSSITPRFLAVLRRLGGGTVERAAPDRQLWPHRDGTDAMYLALLRRVPSSPAVHPRQGATGT